ncbi:MAG: RND transporter, partial [Methylomonas sp.]|nr:RND transporter [Methylomonas sp.]
MGHKRLRAWSASLPLLLLSACGNGGLLATVGPDYQAEPLASAGGWHAPQPISANQLAHHGDSSDLILWWERFNDPILT